MHQSIIAFHASVLNTQCRVVNAIAAHAQSGRAIGGREKVLPAISEIIVRTTPRWHHIASYERSQWTTAEIPVHGLHLVILGAPSLWA
jgi:hypothetical protein